MKNIKLRLLSIIFTLIIAFSMSTTAFAQVDSNLEQESELITKSINDTDFNKESLPFEFVDESGDPLKNVEIIESNQNNSDDGSETTFEIRQDIQNSNKDSLVEPKALVIAVGTMSVKKIEDKQYRVTYDYYCTDVMTKIDLICYKDYPNESNPYKRTIRPNARTYSNTVDLYYTSSGTYTLKLYAQVTSKKEGLLAGVVSSGTKKIVIFD